MTKWIFLPIAMVAVALCAAQAHCAEFDSSWIAPTAGVVDPQGVLSAESLAEIQATVGSCEKETGVPLYVVALPALVEYGGESMQPEAFAALVLEALQSQRPLDDQGREKALVLLLVEEKRVLALALGSAWDSSFFTTTRRQLKEQQEKISSEYGPFEATVTASKLLAGQVRAAQQRSNGPVNPLVIGGLAGGVLLLVLAGVAVYLSTRRKATGLHEAVQEGFNTTIGQKLRRGADPDALDEAGYPPVYYAAGQGDLKTVQALHEFGADLGKPTRQGETALYCASQNGHAGVAAYLLSKGVPVDPLTVHNETPLLIASREGHLEIVAGLLHAGTNVNQQDNRGWSALMVALREGHNDVVNLLLNHNVDVNLAPKDGAHALMMAVKQEDEVLVRRLIDQGADVHHVARDGMCALRIAVLRGNQPIARRLLNAGANVSAPFANKEKPAEMAERQGHAELATYLKKREKRLAACMDILEVVARGDLARIKEIVVQVPQSVNVHSKRSRWTPLLIAVRAEEREIAQTLLDHGADVHTRSIDGKSAIAYAVDTGNLAMVKVLLEGGARIDQVDLEGTDLRSYAEAQREEAIVQFLDSFLVQQEAGYALFQAVKEDDPPRALTILKENPGCVDARTRHERWTPLLQAARESNSGMVRLLMEYHAQVNFCNARGMSPLMYAARNGDLELVRLLLNHGADVRLVSREGNTACDFALDRGHARVVMLLQEVESQLSDLSRTGFPGETKADLAEGEDRGRALDIFQAVQENDIKRLKQVLHYWPGSIRLRWGPSELTPLHMAISAGNHAITQLLVESGADVNAPTREGRMPIHQAVGRADVRLVELLVHHGADIDAISQGLTALRMAEAAGYEDIIEALGVTRNDYDG